jgi:hypothetical protein
VSGGKIGAAANGDLVISGVSDRDRRECQQTHTKQNRGDLEMNGDACQHRHAALSFDPVIKGELCGL